MFIAAEKTASTSTKDPDQQKSMDNEKGYRKNRAIIVDPETLEEALQMMADFKPTRHRDPMPYYPDLCVEGEKSIRHKPGGPNYWHMPFRAKEFIQACNQGR